MSYAVRPDGVAVLTIRNPPVNSLSSAVLAGSMPAEEARAVVAATVALRDRVRAGEADPAELASAVERYFRRHD